MNNIKIISDSSSNIYYMQNNIYKSVPLKIIVGDKEYSDTQNLDTKSFINDLKTSKSKSSTSCPNVYDWYKSFEGIENIFVVTISSAVSGCNSTAQIAREEYLADYPNTNICVLDSLSTGPEIALIIDKLSEYIERGLNFEEIERKIKRYMKQTHLLFFLKNMDNLVNNGRVSAAAAKISKLLNIHILGTASQSGTIEAISKCRGEKQTITAVLKKMKEMNFLGGKVVISHCQNIEAAHALKNKILNEFKNTIIKINECGGLCSFYAEEGGLLIGFEA